MVITFSALITLIIILTGQHVCSKVITVNTRGNNNTKCCVNGSGLCSSLFNALEHASSDTVINITSEALVLKGDVKIGSGDLSNITITSQFTRITCNNTTIYCESCDNVTLRGITWVNCNFLLSNSTIVNCALMHNSVVVSGNISIIQSELSDTSLSRINNTDYNGYVNLTILGSIVYSLDVSDSSCLAQWNVTITNNTFTSTMYFQVYGLRFSVCADVLHGMHIANITVSSAALIFDFVFDLSATKGHISVSLLSSVFSGKGIQCTLTTYSEDSHTSVLITDTEFTNNTFTGSIFSSHLVSLSILSNNKLNIALSTVSLKNVNITNSFCKGDFTGHGALSIESESHTEVYFTNVNFIGNNFMLDSAVYILLKGSSGQIVIHLCNFMNNTFAFAPILHIAEHMSTTAVNYNSIIVSNCSIFNNNFNDGQAIYIQRRTHYYIDISSSVFVHNLGGYIIDAELDLGGIVVVNISTSNFTGNTLYSFMSIPTRSSVHLTSSQFISNVGICLSVLQTNIILTSSNFINNTGGCFHVSGGQLSLNGGIFFDANSADKGGALYIDRETSIDISAGSDIHFIKNSATLGGAIFVNFVCSLYDDAMFIMAGNAQVTFTGNVARVGYSGDSIYFSIPKNCEIDTNTSDPSSWMYNPYHFNYPDVTSTDCCDVSCSNKHNMKFPVITSPHSLILCGDSVKQLSNDTYFISNTILGKPSVFKGGVMDYFKKPSQPVQFNLNCTTCSSDIILSSSKYISVDSNSPLSLTFFRNNCKLNSNINVTVVFTSLLDSYIQPIIVHVIVEIVPCYNHIGYAYSRESNACICYHSGVVKCSEHYNEIEDGYWIGVISSQPTTSLCPAHYCSFIHRNKFTLGYSELPDDVDAQCNHHRRGRACGECSPGYTLAYDTTDCISVNQCGTILTVVVIASTCAYWVIIVVGVFALLYFNKRIPLGYTYAVIYYYSIVGVLFSSNMYISESAFLFISVMSSFTQLSPEFLGTLCLVKGTSGIDQLFIHYSHPIAVSLLVVMFIIAAKFSRKLSDFVSRCRIVRIICVLLLLSYTSIVSTSLQLLRPLTFTDIQQVYTYSSPSIQYFHDRHIIYGIVAIVCELVVGIGLPLLLLLEPFINKKINFVRIKPLLDEFQDCYKEKKKFRWFASYYLICRQIILVIVLIGDSDHSRLFILLITCIIIATIHTWIRPYKSALLNLFDGFILQLMVVGISINVFDFLQPAATELVLVLVIFPLFVICTVGIRQVIKRKLHGEVYIDNEDIPRNDGSDEYQEPLLGFASVNN